MIPGYLVAFGPWLGVLLVLVVVALCWLALWLLEKHGWRHWCGWAIVAGIALCGVSAVLS